MRPIRRALLSVSDKTGLLELAQFLRSQGILLLSTGGTAKFLTQHQVLVTEVSEYTEFPEVMDGRVKTLHPKIHGGILARRGVDEAVLIEQGITPIDLVVVNLYPFGEVSARADCTLASAVENIDIGGPALIRAAAKNHRDVAVVVDPKDYVALIEELRTQHLSPETRYRLAVKAFTYTARYDSLVANFLSSRSPDGQVNTPCPEHLHLGFDKTLSLRYGENPHQLAAFYQSPEALPACIARAHLVQGKALSYNNIADADAALECVKQFASPACVIVKHLNPCGVALGTDLLHSYERAYLTDPSSAFGGIIAFNRPLDEATARCILERQFVEVIVVPAVTSEAEAALKSKPNVRVLITGVWDSLPTPGWEYKSVTGGLLVQERDTKIVTREQTRSLTRRVPTETEWDDLLFAWKVAKFVKSNAIVYCKDQATLGVGAGQMSRVYSARIAGIKADDADLNIHGAVMASDAFFPFRDGLDSAAQAGIRAVIQPGGSMRDDEVIAAADEHDIAMVFTGVRHFRH